MATEKKGSTLYALLLAMLSVATVSAQNVPATAREAAKMPQYAAKLAHAASRVSPQPEPRKSAGRSRLTSGLWRNFVPGPGVLYDNGPINGTTDAWTINFGFLLADSFAVLNDSTVGGFNFGVWEFAGDRLTSVDWLISSYPDGGTVYGSGTANGSNLTDRFISINQYGYDIDNITVTGLNVNLTRAAISATMCSAW